MRPQPAEARFRGRVDEGGGARVLGGVGEVGALGVMRFQLVPFREEHIEERDGGEAGGVDDGGCAYRCRFLRRCCCWWGLLAGWKAAGPGVDVVVSGVRSVVEADDGGVVDYRAAGGEELCFEVGHERVRVYDAGCGGFQDAGFGSDIGFAVLGFPLREEVGGDVDVLGVCMELLELAHLRVILSDDPFLCVAEGNVLALAEVVEPFPALDAEPCFEGVDAVV